MKKIKMIILRWALRLAVKDKKHREAILRHELNHLALERIQRSLPCSRRHRDRKPLLKRLTSNLLDKRKHETNIKNMGSH